MLATIPEVYADSTESTNPNFSHDTVIELARKRAQEEFKAPDKAPESLASLDKSAYQQIEFNQDEAIWNTDPSPFSLQLVAAGYIYEQLIEIELVEDGQASPVLVSETSFKGPDAGIIQLIADIDKYAGLRLNYPLNRQHISDEFLVFQGASYFRGISKDQVYGLSARGLAINVAQPTGEQYPIFRKFWIERPQNNDVAIVVHALLDSHSVTGAYQFHIQPGEVTRMDISVTLFPREDIPHIGLAPLTSMYLHGTLDLSDTADYRPAVHNSEGLQIETGNRERIWRPLYNPKQLQISAFTDENPRGFGLIQRNRDFDYYQDLQAQYQRRPSAWVQPLNDWGKGQVELVEIPSDSQANDNIVLYWKPAAGLIKDQPFTYSYRLTLPEDSPLSDYEVRIVRSAYGQKLLDSNHEMVVDFANMEIVDFKNIQLDASISEGKILATRIEENPNIAGARVYLTFDPENADMAELRLQLLREQQPIAATWLYRWITEGWPRIITR